MAFTSEDLFPSQTFTFNLLESVLTTLCNDDNEFLLKDSLSLKSAFSEACTTLNASINDLTNVKIALLSFAALAEIDHSALGKDGEFQNVHFKLFNSCR